MCVDDETHNLDVAAERVDEVSSEVRLVLVEVGGVKVKVKQVTDPQGSSSCYK